MAIKSHQTKVYRQNLGTGSFVLVDEVRDVTPPSYTRTIHDATVQSSTYPVKLTGMPGGGDLQFGILFVPGNTSHEAILDSLVADQIDVWRVEYSNGKTWTASGAVANFEPSEPLDDISTANVTVAVFGQVTRA